MKHLVQLLGVTILLVFAVSCDDPITQARNQQQVKAGLTKTLTQLTSVAGFDTANIKNLQGQIENDSGRTCYYASSFMILGASLSEQEALDRYNEALQVLGWTPEGKQYIDTKALVRGTNERTVVEYGPRSDQLESILEEIRARGIYRGVIVVYAQYIIPTWKEC